jgi:glycogen operon protein
MAKNKSNLLPGVPRPLGATFDGAGVNFALFSEHAAGVALCLFGGTDGNDEISRIALTERTEHVWHAYLRGIKPGQRYGYRVTGVYDPAAGQRFNPAKLLLDPYARAIDREPNWHDSMLDYRIGPAADAHRPVTGHTIADSRNSARAMPKCVVVDSEFNWSGDVRPALASEDLVIYEAHVKGMTAQHRDIPARMRGTYAAFASQPVISHLTALGVNAVELMPIHQIAPERRLYSEGLTNYWGYSTIGYFAPDIRFASSRGLGAQVVEFKQMVKTLHQAGIEVILDVVYNHTGEGNELGSTVCFRGLDNRSYYRLRSDGSGRCEDFTGTGNSLDLTNPAVLQLVMDSLRYWVIEMHVDGFRFDLATTLARGARGEFGGSPFLAAIQQDPALRRVKFIAEPWDLGDHGYRVGGFPVIWKEWNAKYRDHVRDFWRGENNVIGEFASRITGSSDLYRAGGRSPLASVNFVTSHDGFTLADLVAYNVKHNEANGEGNRDGENYNRSWNCGAEGPTEQPEIKSLRAQQQRNFLATLILSQGVPMILAGDELGRSQRGNNNAYCQDNPISWLDWKNADWELIDFTRRLIALRHAHPVFRRRAWFTGNPPKRGRLKDLEWFRPDGAEMTAADWTVGYAKTLGMFLNGQAMSERDSAGMPLADDTFFLMFNAYREPMNFRLPPRRWGRRWTLVVDTANPRVEEGAKSYADSSLVAVEGRSIVALRRIEQA